MQVVLVMFKADGERRSFSLTHDVTVLGRREDCDLRIPLGDVSRKHCRLVKEGPSLRLEDLGSSNGTFLNGKRVQEAIVNPGDTIQVGPVQFVAQLDGVPADDQVQPHAAATADTTAAEAPETVGAAEAPVNLDTDDLINLNYDPDDSAQGQTETPIDLLDEIEPQSDPKKP